MPNNGKSRTDIYEVEQRKIDLQANARRILILLVQFQKSGDEFSFSDGLEWTTEMISGQLNIEVTEAEDALAYLLKNRLVQHRSKQWFIASIAEEVLQHEIKATHFNLGSVTRIFVQEAESGMDRFGDETQLRNVALQGCAITENPVNDVENETIDLCTRASKIRAIARDLSMSVQEVNEGLQTGRVGRCNGIPGEVEPHWGEFHFHNGKNGQRRQTRCIECRKKARRKK